VFRHAYKLGLEGIVSKRLGSPYRSGRSTALDQEQKPKAPSSEAGNRRGLDMTELSTHERQFLHALADALRAAGSTVPSVPHLQTLLILAENEGRSHGDYTSRSGYSESEMVRFVTNLQNAGLVTPRAGKTTLTPKGRALVAELLAAGERN
jgi:DNA-binding MarR family transcriptional regulator